MLWNWALAALLAACGTAGRSGTASGPEPGAGDGVAARVRADSLRRPYTQADIRFMQHMLRHHRQAVLIAGWAPSHGAGPEVRRLARRILAGQEGEIAVMRQWLEERGQSGFADGHAMHMPGLLTEAELRELDAARGETFDRLFLARMIAHHRGAVAMVRELFDTPDAAQDETVFRFANAVSVDQTTEIARMEAMLATSNTETQTQ